MTATMTLPFCESKPQSSATRRIYISRGTAKRIARDARARDMECVVSYLLHSSDEGDAWRSVESLRRTQPSLWHRRNKGCSTPVEPPPHRSRKAGSRR
jgi:hypothetical protein